MRGQLPAGLVIQTSEILNEIWSEICQQAEQDQLQDWLTDETLLEDIRAAVNSKTKSYRYVLPTQIAAKLADLSLDARCIQVARGGSGAFDARTIAHKVIVPFDQANNSVLGGSSEPYVNNPLRILEISLSYANAQKESYRLGAFVSFTRYCRREAGPKIH